MAATEGNRAIKNAPYRLTFPISLVTDGTLVTSVSTPDSEISKDGAAFADCTNEATEIGSTGVYTLDLSATEMTAEEIVVLVKHATANGIRPFFQVRTEPCLESGVATGGGASTITARSGGVAADDILNGATIELVRGTGAGQVRTISDCVSSTGVITVDSAWVTQPVSGTVYIVHPRVGLPPLSNAFIQAEVDDVSASATSFDTNLTDADGFYDGSYVLILDGALAGLARPVSAYLQANGNITVSTPFPSAPADGVRFAIIGNAD